MSAQQGQSQTQTEGHAPGGERKITVWNGIGFGIGDFYGGGQGAIVSMYLSLFWTTFAGLDIAQAQGIQGMATMISAITAVVIGALSDNLYQYRFGRRMGRRHFFFKIGAPLLLVTALMWVPGLGYWTYFFAFLLWTVLSQWIMIPYGTLPSEMTRDYTGRTVLSTVRMWISNISTVVIPFVCAGFLKFLGEGKGSTFTIMGVMWIVVFAACIALMSHFTWERTPEEVGVVEEDAGDRLGWLKSLGKQFLGYFTTLRIRIFQKHMVIYLLAQTFIDVFGTVYTFFVIYNWSKSAAFASALSGIGFITTIVYPINGVLFKKVGARVQYSIAFLSFIASLLAFYWLYKNTGTVADSLWMGVMIVSYVLFLLSRSMIWYLLWAVYPFIPDVDEIVTHERREGLFTATVYFFRRITAGLGSIGVGAYLASQGFLSGSKTQTPQAVQAIANVGIIVVVIAIAIAWLVSLTFNLNEKTHGVLTAEIERLRAGGSKDDVKPEVRKLVESMTGVKYEKCWPQAAE